MNLELIIIPLMTINIILIVVTLAVLIGVRQFYWKDYNRYDEFNFDRWARYRNIGIAEGKSLDRLAHLYGLQRKLEEGDMELRGRILEKYASLRR